MLPCLVKHGVSLSIVNPLLHFYVRLIPFNQYLSYGVNQCTGNLHMISKVVVLRLGRMEQGNLYLLAARLQAKPKPTCSVS